ncbi:hypothetical protein F1880_000755 [Penicillium rolfsii]|nr:hypothetical protein F1880_000755 [Penicillium rolfsii]
MTATPKPRTDRTVTTPVVSTPFMTTSVLSTPEILEMILVQTDIRTLLTSAQRVCRDWLNLITTSPSIQKALYFAPTNVSEEEPNEKTLNPLLMEKFHFIFPSKDRPDSYSFDFSDLQWTKDSSSLTPMVRADASWRKMLVQQPPISELGFFGVFHAKRGDSARCSKIAAQERKQDKCKGLRMGRLFDILLFARHVHFSVGTTTRIYWAAGPPVEFKESFETINVAFHKMLARFGIVIYTRQVMQCRIEVDFPLNGSQATRRDIIKAYREQGIEVDSKAQEIEASREFLLD